MDHFFLTVRHTVMRLETRYDPCAALLESSRTGKGQGAARQGTQRVSTESRQVTGRKSGQAARNNNPRQSKSGQADNNRTDEKTVQDQNQRNKITRSEITGSGNVILRTEFMFECGLYGESDEVQVCV